MIESDVIPQIGQIVVVTRGRDAGQYAIIIGLVDERYALLADGDKRKFDQPKKKNIQHLQTVGYVSPEVKNSIADTGRVTNGKLRFALARYMNENALDKKKGDDVDGER